LDQGGAALAAHAPGVRPWGPTRRGAVGRVAEDQSLLITTSIARLIDHEVAPLPILSGYPAVQVSLPTNSSSISSAEFL
jgi:hypothetical protein